MRDFHKGVWQMSLAMLISGSIGAFVLLSVCPSRKWSSGAVLLGP